MSPIIAVLLTLDYKLVTKTVMDVLYRLFLAYQVFVAVGVSF